LIAPSGSSGSSATASSYQLWAAAGRGGCGRSITDNAPACGSPSKPSRYWPESTRRCATPSRTTTWLPTAPIDRPDNGLTSGSWRRSAFSERVMRAGGTFAAASACAVRSTIRSWNENSQVLRGPRWGATKPALISARIVLRGRRSSFSTSATV
jgi:hypothetical protein